MNTNKYMTLTFLAAVLGLLCAASVYAGIDQSNRINKYKNLHSIELKQIPLSKSENGLERLGNKESSYHEELPMQLTSAIKNLSSKSYKRTK